MAIAFGAIGAKTVPTAVPPTTVDIAYPASPGVADMAVAARAVWNAVGQSPADETGWTNGGQLFGGNAGGAVDNHRTYARADTKQLAGGEAGNVTFDQNGTPDGLCGVMARYTKGAAQAWATIQSTTGDDATHAANRSATATGTLDLQPGDWVIAIAASGTDAALTITSPAITAAGLTFGTTNRRTSGAGAIAGQDGNVELFDAQVATGSGTVSPTLAFTTATSQSGPVVFIRLRVGTVITPATETDTAVALSRTRSRTLTPAPASSAAAALSRSRQRTLAPAAETDTAIHLTYGATIDLTPTTGTDVAVPLSRSRARTLAPAPQSTATVPLTRQRSRPVTPAAQYDQALPLPRTRIRDLTPATQTDTIPPVGRSRSRTGAPAAETTTTSQLARQRSRSVTPATGPSQVVPLTRTRLRALVAAAETDAAAALARTRARTLAIAAETTTVVTTSRQRSRSIAPSAEPSVVIQLLRSRSRNLSPAASTEISIALSQERARELAPAIELTEAVAIARGGPKVITWLTVTDVDAVLGIPAPDIHLRIPTATAVLERSP